MATRGAARWCKFSPAEMSNGFVQRGGWWVVGQFLLLLAVVVLGLTCHATSKPLLIFVIGLVFLAASAVCGLAGLLALGRNLTPFPKPSASTQLVQHGIYALIRHPLYTAVFCAAVGWSLVWQSWLALAASLALGLLLVGTGAAILWSAGVRLQHLDELPAVASIALWTALAALVAKEGLFRYMLIVAEKLRSPMLVANAWHARSDAASSLVAAAGIGGSLAGYRFLDPVAAVIVGFMILRMGAKFSYEAMRELIDTGVSDDEVKRIRATLRETSGVLGLHELRTRHMANRVLADAHIQVDARISVSEGHRIAEMARVRVLARHPDVLDVLVHVDAEEDVDSAISAIDLPEREVLLGHLRSLLGEELPQFEKTLLHYLGKRVEAEIFLSPEICLDPAHVARLELRLGERLTGDPYFSAVSLNCRIAPR